MLEPQQFQTQGFIDPRLCREHNSGMPLGAPPLYLRALIADCQMINVFEGFYLTKKENKPVIWL
jgi:hypothetical protein